MTQAIQSQSSSLQFFFDLCKSGYTKVKDFFVNNSMNIISGTKLSLINKYISLKSTLKEFFDQDNNDNEKLKSHIKYIDTILTILIVATIISLIYRR